MIAMQYRPLSDQSWCRPDADRRPHQFKADWSNTLALLERELDHLKADDITLELDVVHAAIRADGSGLKAGQAPGLPAVVLSFESKHGSLTYHSDAFVRATWGSREGWRANVRAIALTLEALRAVDRYGATTTGEQYTGFLAIEAGAGAAPSHMTAAEAESVLQHVLGAFDRSEGPERIRRARAMSHPDRHDGDRTLWDQVEQAAVVLGVSR